MTHRFWQTTRFQISLSTPKIMGIVNLTPDSFSDGGAYSGTIASALKHAEMLLRDGADILDIGGESTRPNAIAVSPEEEWARVRPVLAELISWNIPISLDTRRTAVMRQALEHGFVDIINDVQALQDEGALTLLAQQSDTGICLMHMQGQPQTMQQSPQYTDVVAEVRRYLQSRADAAVSAGIAPQRLMLDPGFGFGKTTAHNAALMRNLSETATRSLPILAGVSRKRMIGEWTGRENPADRIAGSIAGALFAVMRGATVLRVHDVRETSDALKVWLGIQNT